MKKKALLLVLAAVVLVAASIGGTLAWLQDSATVTNTFTVGKVDIDLTEPDWTQAGYTDQNPAKIVPGVEIPKDPTVTVKAGSEECWVFVKVDNQVNATVANAVSLNIDTTNWNVHSSSGSVTVYVYKSTVPTPGADLPLPDLFTKVTPDKMLTAAQVASLNSKTIVVTAYAIQAAGNATAAAAWTNGGF